MGYLVIGNDLKISRRHKYIYLMEANRLNIGMIFIPIKLL